MFRRRLLQEPLCPNGSAGCVPVAIAMAMAYCEAPSAITYTCPDLGAGTETLNWRIIKEYVFHIHSIYLIPA